jgi:hypothetical protein
MGGKLNEKLSTIAVVKNFSDGACNIIFLI